MARTLRVEVTFLGSLQQVAGRATTWLEVPPPGTVDRVLALLRERMPQFVGVACTCLVNGAPADPHKPLAWGDGLFLMPPE
ncbi:MAG: MoaD/ThiS family protein [Planctomycetes bacterium]|nr:MoaD/ThiS family protein [Planctomycetota bacterium]